MRGGGGRGRGGVWGLLFRFGGGVTFEKSVGRGGE